MANAASSGLYSLSVFSAVLETTAIAQAISKLTTRNKSFLYWAQYDGFMALISFSETGEPLMLRAVEHISDTFHPDLAQLIKEVVLQSDLKDPGLGIIPCGASTSSQCVEALTAAHQDKPAPLFDTGCLEVLDEAAFAEKLQAAGVKGETTGLMPEHLFWMDGFWKTGDPKSLHDACAGDFHQLQPDRLAAIAPIAVTRTVKLLIPALILCCLGAIAAGLFLGYSYMQAVQAPSWNTTQVMINDRTKNQQQLHNTLSSYQALENLLVPRSSYALGALFLTRLIPADSGIYVTDVHYDFRALPSKGGPIGIERSWTINGETTPEAQAALVSLTDPEAVNKLLTEVATQYNYPAYVPSKKQNLKVTVSNSASSAPGSQNGKKNLSFTIVITLTLDSKDAFALQPVAP